MRLVRIAGGKSGARSRHFVRLGTALGLLALLACARLADAAALGESDELTRRPDSIPEETNQIDAALSGIERSDCLIEDAVCRSECIPGASKRECGADPCPSRLMLCLATLPLGKSPSLPTICSSADQQAFQRLERQGELLDADPVLFAESYTTLIRARIACRAGDPTKALNLYDEVLESMREKLVPAGQASKAGR